MGSIDDIVMLFDIDEQLDEAVKVDYQKQKINYKFKE